MSVYYCILLQSGYIDKVREYLLSLSVVLINAHNGAGEEAPLAKCLFCKHDPQKLYIHKKPAWCALVISDRWCLLASQPRLLSKLQAD